MPIWRPSSVISATPRCRYSRARRAHQEIVKLGKNPDTRYTRKLAERSYTGLLCYATPCIDIDVLNPKVVEELITLADDTFDPAPVRIGASPKAALLYGATELFNKVTSRPFSLPGDDLDDPTWKPHRIEILANGQQLVAYAIHPGTRQPYTWYRADPLNLPWEQLPSINRDSALTFLQTADTLLEEKLGGIFVKRQAGKWVLDEREHFDYKKPTRWNNTPNSDPAYWWCWDASPEDVIEILQLRSRKNGSWVGRCPLHGSYSGKSSNLSDVFQMRRRENGALIYTCFAGCQSDEIAQEVAVKIEAWAQWHDIGKILGTMEALVASVLKIFRHDRPETQRPDLTLKRYSRAPVTRARKKSNALRTTSPT